ncbi:MAG: NusG domain II-containing protein [Alkalibacterium sp.]|nr:NusG domain II-containing protein [Alkalibacterium sp.]
MKPLDVVIIICLLLASFIPHIVYGIQLGNIDDDARIMATVKISGEEVYRVELSEETPHEEFRLEPSQEQYNIIEVDGTRIRNKEDNSPDQLGVRRGWISQPGETAVVLPHQLIIEIHAENQDGQEIYEEDDIIIPM